MRPFDTYTGGKGASGVHQKIINQIRPHDVYIEPFVGNGYIFSRLKRSGHVILNDISSKVAKEWQKLCLPGVTVKNIDGIQLLKDLHNDLIVNRSKQESFGLAMNKIVVYCDPPYPKESRVTQLDMYDYDWTPEKHIEFLKAVTSIPPDLCDILISTYPNEMYEKYLSTWRSITFKAKTRGYVATEVLYMNYPEPTSLHDCRYLGEDYRERERIKRKAQRWEANFKSLPTLERYKILELLTPFIK